MKTDFLSIVSSSESWWEALESSKRRARWRRAIRYSSGMVSFTRVVLHTGADGRAAFREEAVPLAEGTPQARLSQLFAARGYQLRHSPVGFRSDWHCTPQPQWVFILAGEMEIGLADGSSRVFRPGEHFYSADTLPEGADFCPGVHGHWSAQRGSDPLVTLFLKDSG
jgi:hypothetical protein